MTFYELRSVLYHCTVNNETLLLVVPVFGACMALADYSEALKVDHQSHKTFHVILSLVTASILTIKAFLTTSELTQGWLEEFLAQWILKLLLSALLSLIGAISGWRAVLKLIASHQR